MPEAGAGSTLVLVFVAALRFRLLYDMKLLRAEYVIDPIRLARSRKWFQDQ